MDTYALEKGRFHLESVVIPPGRVLHIHGGAVPGHYTDSVYLNDILLLGSTIILENCKRAYVNTVRAQWPVWDKNHSQDKKSKAIILRDTNGSAHGNRVLNFDFHGYGVPIKIIGKCEGNRLSGGTIVACYRGVVYKNDQNQEPWHRIDNVHFNTVQAPISGTLDKLIQGMFQFNHFYVPEGVHPRQSERFETGPTPLCNISAVDNLVGPNYHGTLPKAKWHDDWLAA